jgi:hypothetical protein
MRVWIVFLICSAAAMQSHADTGGPALSGEQQRAIGIVVARLVPAKLPEQIESLGVVLDATLLTADLGEADATAAAEHAASAELARLTTLYKNGGVASLRVLEAARAEQSRARAQAELAAARFSLHWSPLVSMSSAGRRRMLAAVTNGHALLVRADLPGRQTLGFLPDKAVLTVDGIQVPAHCVGVLRMTTDSQAVGLLLEVPNAPIGLGPGARVPVQLSTAPRLGRVVPREALFYDESGAFVYKRLARKSAVEPYRYGALRVKLLVTAGAGWLIDGVDDDDDIVVHGAGLLWSLQGAGPAASDDDD